MRRTDGQEYGFINGFFSKPIVKVFISPLAVAFLTFAITHFFDSTNIKQAVVQNMSERFEIIKENMSYESALDELTEYVNDIEKEKTKLDSKVEKLNGKIASQEEEITKLKQDIDRIDQVSRAEDYANKGNYKAAIAILIGIENKTDEVTVLLNDYTSIYQRDILNEAESLADDGKYEEAKSIIDDALKIIPESQVLIDERKHVEPKYLNKEAECYNAENIVLLGEKDSVTITGKKYRNGFKAHNNDFAGQFLNGAYSSSISYNLDGKYKQLSGIVGNVDFSGGGTPGEDDAGQVYSSQVTIWGTTNAGETIELKSFDFSPKDRSIEFTDVSLQGIDTLEFQIECGGNSEVGVVELRIR